MTRNGVFDSIPLGLASIGVVVLAFLLVSPQPATAESNPKLTVMVGQSITHRLPTPIETVSIANSDVADVVVANKYEILLNGKAIGFTTLVVWDSTRATAYDVVVRSPFSDQKIELHVKIAEINRSKSGDYGFDFQYFDEFNTDESVLGGVFGGEVATPSIPLRIFSGENPTPGVSMAFRYARGAENINTMIRAMQEQGVLRILAEPNLVAASGQEASFLSGGEIPVPIATASTQGASTVTIEWKEFGVGIDFLPTIVDSGVINLQVSPTVSSLDYSNGIVLSGFSIPALRTRRAETSVELKDGELLAIGGLIMEEESKTTRRIPFLGHIPLLKYFFSNTHNALTESELLFVVSVHITHALAKGATIDLPGTKVDEE